MSEQSVTKNTTYLTVAYIGQKILSFFYFVMVARFIGVEDLGKYTFALSFTTIFAVMVDFGLTQALIRELAKGKQKARDILSSALSIKLVLAVFVYGVIFLLINIMGYPQVTKNLVYVAGLIMALDQFAVSFWGAFRGARNLKLEAISIVINQIIIVGVGLTVLFLRLPLIYLMLPFVGGSLFSLIFSACSVRKKLKIKFKLKFDKRLGKYLFKIGVPFALIAIFSRIYGYIDTVFLSKMIGDRAVGFYSVAMKIPFALQFIPAALAAAIFPAFSRHFVHDKDQLKLTFDKVMKFLMVVVLPISAGIAVLAKPIINFFYGNEYLPSVIPLQILICGLIFVFLNFPLGSLLNGCNRHLTNTFLVGTTMIINIIINLLVIPQYSYIGAAATFLVTHGFLFLAGLMVARKIITYDKKLLFKTFIQSMISVAVMVGVIWFLKPNVHFFGLIFVGALVYAIMIFLTKGITWKELKYFKKTFISKKNV